MDSPRAYWPKWTESLQNLGLDGFAAMLLEGGRPIHIVAAQLLYIGQPFATPQTSASMGALANLLEEEDEAQAFIAILKGQST